MLRARWSDEETERLREALASCATWKDVTAHVGGGRTKLQCRARARFAGLRLLPANESKALRAQANGLHAEYAEHQAKIRATQERIRVWLARTREYLGNDYLVTMAVRHDGAYQRDLRHLEWLREEATRKIIGAWQCEQQAREVDHAAQALKALTQPKNMPSRWTPEEHARYAEAYETFGANWCAVSEFVGTRTNVQCRTHHQKVSRRRHRAQPTWKVPMRDAQVFANFVTAFRV